MRIFNVYRMGKVEGVVDLQFCFFQESSISHWSLSISPENIRKTGVEKETSDMKRVEAFG